MKRPATDRIGDCLASMMDAIGRIESYVAGLNQTAFLRSPLVQDAVIRNFEVIGEAANRIALADPDFAKRHADLRLDLAYRMRNALIHGYDAINLVTVWNTIRFDLPLLKQQIADLVERPRDR